MSAIRPARTETFEHTIAGLLSKRADLLGEAESIRDRLAEIKNDIDALDRTLGAFGYDGDLDAQMPRQKRHVVFGRGELFKACMTVLREAKAPLTSREIAQRVVELNGHDARDRRYVTDLVKRVGKCLRDSNAPVSKGADERGNAVWALA